MMIREKQSTFVICDGSGNYLKDWEGYDFRFKTFKAAKDFLYSEDTLEDIPVSDLYILKETTEVMSFKKSPTLNSLEVIHG